MNEQPQSQEEVNKNIAEQLRILASQVEAGTHNQYVLGKRAVNIKEDADHTQIDWEITVGYNEVLFKRQHPIEKQD